MLQTHPKPLTLSNRMDVVFGGGGQLGVLLDVVQQRIVQGRVGLHLERGNPTKEGGVGRGTGGLSP